MNGEADPAMSAFISMATWRGSTDRRSLSCVFTIMNSHHHDHRNHGDHDDDHLHDDHDLFDDNQHLLLILALGGESSLDALSRLHESLMIIILVIIILMMMNMRTITKLVIIMILVMMIMVMITCRLATSLG